MQAIYGVVLGLHVLGGAVGLLSMGGPLVAPKGGTAHHRWGWIFVAAMTLSTITGVVIAASWLTIPGWVKTLPADPAAAARVATRIRDAGAFFGVLSLMSAQAIVVGMRATRDRTSSPTAHPTARVVTALLGGAAVLALVRGLPTMDPFLLVGAGLGGVNAWAGLRPRRDKSWLRIHIEAMLGACTVATTAFVVQMTGRITTGAVASALAWTLPVVLGMGLTALWTRRLQQRKMSIARA